MIKVYCNGTRIQCLRQGELNVGMAGAPIEFDFSSEWDGLGKTAVFRCDGERDMIIGADGKTTVPYEILTTPGMDVEVGVYAVKEDGTTWPAPTTYCKIGRVGEGADPSVDGSYPPTPDVGEQAIEAASKALQAAAEAQEVAADIQRRADSGEFDGEQGPVGPAGADGEDYVLTEADKDYIADLVAERVDVSLELDTTLTRRGVPADAKAVGDALENVGGKAYVQDTEPAQMEVGEFWYNPDEAGGGSADLTGYATEAWVQEGYQPKGDYLTEQNLSGYAKSEDIPTKPSDIGAQPAGNYATKDELPTTLPNPHKLTFSGAVNAEYDGSEAVEVEIPQGGGGGGSDKKLELIYEGTLEESVTSWEISKDNNGNPFALSEAVLVLTSVIAGDDNIYQNIGTCVNGKSAANNAVVSAFQKDSPRYYYSRVKMYPGVGPEVMQFAGGANYNWQPLVGGKMGYKFNDLWKAEAITSLSVVGMGGKSIGLAGTSIVVYGVRA